MAEASGTNQGRAEDFSLVVSIYADPGEDVILSVHLSHETSVVSMNISWCRGRELIYQYKSGLESTNSDYENRVSLSVQELERGNVSLTLRNVQESDSGEYTCKVYHDGHQKTVIVNLQVRGERQLQREIVEQWRQIKKVKLDGQIKKLELEKQRVELEMEGQIKKLELEKQIMELEMERQIMEREKRIEDLERQMKELPLPTHTLHGEEQPRRRTVDLQKQMKKVKPEKQSEDLEGSSSRRRNSIHGIPPRMSDDDGTPMTPETDDKRGRGIRCRQLLSCSSSRRRNSIHGIPPRMSGDDETPMTPETEEQRETRDTSGVERESGDPDTTQTGKETTVTDQETPGTSPQALQRTSTSVISTERATQTQEDPGATVQMDQERRQESESTEQE